MTAWILALLAYGVVMTVLFLVAMAGNDDLAARLRAERMKNRNRTTTPTQGASRGN